MKKLFLFITVAAFGICVMNSCSKDDAPNTTNAKHVKATITLSNNFLKAEGDYFEATISGANNNSSFVDWNVNGVKKTGTNVVVGTDDFTGGKTITLESASDVFSGSINFGGFEYGNTPYTITWKIEVGGTVKDEGTETLVKGRDPVFFKSVTF